MNKTAAIAEIKKLFGKYKTIAPSDQKLLRALKDGKLYELFVLSHLLQDLKGRGFNLKFRGTSLNFKAAPGKIKKSDPHFEVSTPHSRFVDFRIFVDIEFNTLGRHIKGASDRSQRHELDIVVVNVDSGYPKHSDIALGVECKAVANFKKAIVKEALGVRRELSLLGGKMHQSMLTAKGGLPPTSVSADPASEFWLAFIHSKGLQYSQSPSLFDIAFKHLEP